MSFTFDEYQEACSRTANTKLGRELFLASLGLGIGGEGGEIEDMIKKHVAHGHPIELLKLEEELGDLLWYVSMLAQAFGLPLSLVASRNVKEKLKERYPEGFSTERSINREA